MKIWFDILTPKQILFFESMARRLSGRNTVLRTSRNYREVAGLMRIRGSSGFEIYGEFGGASAAGKLNASIGRMGPLAKRIARFRPDVAISACSPEASRISYGLGIPHIGFANTPHATAIMRLTVPFSRKILIPQHLSRRDFVQYGIRPRDVVNYNCMDEFVLIKNPQAKKRTIPKLDLKHKKTIVFRTYESQASYVDQEFDTKDLLLDITAKLSGYNIIVLGRYEDEIRRLSGNLPDNTTILNRTVDSGELLSMCDLFIGSTTGTMTREAIFRGVPSISCGVIPSVDEKLLEKKGLVIKAKTADRIVFHAKRLLESKNTGARSRKFISKMSHPYPTLLKAIRDVAGGS